MAEWLSGWVDGWMAYWPQEALLTALQTEIGAEICLRVSSKPTPSAPAPGQAGPSHRRQASSPRAMLAASSRSIWTGRRASRPALETTDCSFRHLENRKLQQLPRHQPGLECGRHKWLRGGLCPWGGAKCVQRQADSTIRCLTASGDRRQLNDVHGLAARRAFDPNGSARFKYSRRAHASASPFARANVSSCPRRAAGSQLALVGSLARAP